MPGMVGCVVKVTTSAARSCASTSAVLHAWIAHSAAAPNGCLATRTMCFLVNVL